MFKYAAFNILKASILSCQSLDCHMLSDGQNFSYKILLIMSKHLSFKSHLKDHEIETVCWLKVFPCVLVLAE